MSKILPLKHKEPHPNPFGKLKLMNIESRIILKSGWNSNLRSGLEGIGLDLTLFGLVLIRMPIN